MPDDDNLKEDLIEMKSCQRLQLLFNKLKLEDFQCAEMKAFPSLAMNAMTVVLPFSTTYFCESGFSTMMYIKIRITIGIVCNWKMIYGLYGAKLNRHLKEY